MIQFFVGMVIGAIVYAFKDTLRTAFEILVARLWEKIFGNKNNPSA